MSLDNVQVGDELILCSLHKNHICRIERVTPTRIIVCNRAFRKRDGREIGRHNQWDSTFIRLPENGELDQIREDQLRRELIRHIRVLCQRDLSSLSVEKLKRLVAMLECRSAEPLQASTNSIRADN